MKLRYFYRINHKKEPIPGSNIRRKSKPGNQWREITPICCNPDAIDCTCGPRYWVQVDGTNKPVDGTLIKRDKYPLMAENIRYQEVDWKSVCCGPASKLLWTFETFDSQGNLTIKENGVEKVNIYLDAGLSDNGYFIPAAGSLIEITLTNICLSSVVTMLYATGGHIYTEENGGLEEVHNFLWNVTEDVNILAQIDCIGR